MPVALDTALTPPLIRLITMRSLLKEASVFRDPVAAVLGHCHCKDVGWLAPSVCTGCLLEENEQLES